MLDVLQPCGFTLEIWKVLLNAHPLHLLHQEVQLLEEENDGDFEEELVLMMDSKVFRDFTSRLVCLSSMRTWSYSLEDSMNRMDVISWKHWNHIWCCNLWPPTSTILNEIFFITKLNSTIPLWPF